MAASLKKMEALYDLLADHYAKRLADEENPMTAAEQASLVKFLQNSGVQPDAQNWDKGKGLMLDLPSSSELDEDMAQ